MKYEKEVDKILYDLLFDEGMSEADYNNIVEDAFKQMETTKETICNNIEIGISKGIPLEQQLSLFKRVLYCLD
jgi:hypothetical protein